MLGHHLPARETRFNGRPMVARLKCYLNPLSPHQPKKCSQSWTPSEKISGSAHGFFNSFASNYKSPKTMIYKLT